MEENTIKEEILRHKQEIQEFSALINSGIFQGNQAHKVLSLQSYFRAVLIQLDESLSKLPQFKK